MIPLETILKAHQYLYYVLGTPVLTDREYDMWCRDNNLDSKGGSDLESSYTEEEKEIARGMLKR
jgi:NAD-dependent DNA ligase